MKRLLNFFHGIPQHHWRPCGQLMAIGFLPARPAAIHFRCSSGMFTLIAAWQQWTPRSSPAIVSIEIAAFSRSMPSRISVRSFSALVLRRRRHGLDRHALRPHGLDLEAVAQFFRDLFKRDDLPRDSSLPTA